eukprot:gene3253-43499_t
MCAEVELVRIDQNPPPAVSPGAACPVDTVASRPLNRAVTVDTLYSTDAHRTIGRAPLL